MLLTENEGSMANHSNAIKREVIVARPAQRRAAPGSSLRSDHDHPKRMIMMERN
ncbi:MAG: hypothetical protein ACYDAB_03025 [bacterium]